MTFGTTFLASNHNPPANNFFQGYCFIGTDFIYGAEGAQHFQTETGTPITPALDGCYVTAKQTKNTYIFDVDFAGYTILYYYHDTKTWAVSNSFAQIVDYLRDQNIRIQPNYTHLIASTGRGMAASQLFSLETPVHGIQVAPRTHTLTITPNEATLQPRPATKTTIPHYQHGLTQYLKTWVTRFETLLASDNANLTTALTGGVDSRANFALLQAARQRLGHTTTPPHLYCLSTPDNQIDYQIATQVASHYNLTVDNQRRAGHRPLTPTESYQQYRNLALGVYHPLYIPENQPSTMDINISGGGGGVHRKIYELHTKSKNPQAFFERYARHFKRIGHPEHTDQFIQDAQQFLNTIIQPGDDPLRALLREGRVRYHTGRDARYGISLSPLHCVAADQTQRLAGPDRLEEGQFNYDIMYSLHPELLDMPYDRDTKAPTKAHHDRLTKALIPLDANPGTLWAPPAGNPSHQTTTDTERNAAYQQAFDTAMTNPFVTNFWDQDTLDLAQQRMNLLTSDEEFGNAANGKPISTILATDLITPG